MQIMAIVFVEITQGIGKHIYLHTIKPLQHIYHTCKMQFKKKFCFVYICLLHFLTTDVNTQTMCNRGDAHLENITLLK